MAFLGIERSLPLLHGSQGCTAFALVLMVRHFREAIPLQTTAMSEISTILGGAENVEAAIGNIYDRAKPRLIGICSTALTETRGEDMAADLRAIRDRHPEWQGALEVVFASTPDYGGSLEEGWGKAITAIIKRWFRRATHRGRCAGSTCLSAATSLRATSRSWPTWCRGWGSLPSCSRIFPARSTATSRKAI